MWSNDEYDLYDNYRKEEERLKDTHDGAPRYNVAFSSISTKGQPPPGVVSSNRRQEPDKKPNFNHDYLGHKSNKTLTMYLIFCFILANDSTSLCLLL